MHCHRDGSSLIVTFATGGMKKIRNMSFVDGVFLILSALAIPAREDFYSRALAGLQEIMRHIYMMYRFW